MTREIWLKSGTFKKKAWRNSNCAWLEVQAKPHREIGKREEQCVLLSGQLKGLGMALPHMLIIAFMRHDPSILMTVTTWWFYGR